MNADRRLGAAVLRSPLAPAPRHDSVLAALDAAVEDGRPFATITSDATRQHGFAEVRDGARIWATLLRERGTQPGEPVPIVLSTSPAFVDALIGTMLAGAIPVPLAPPMTFGSMERSLRNLAAIVQDCGARRVIASPRVRKAIAADAELPKQVDTLGEEDVVGVKPSFRAEVGSAGAADTAFIQYTSGTTGRPKGVVISHRALMANTEAIRAGLDLSGDDIGVSWLPLFHDMGLVGVLLTALCHPFRIHVLSPELFAMRPLRWLRTIAETGATLSAAPNFAWQLCLEKAAETDKFDLSRWRLALSGAEPVRAETVNAFVDRFRRDGMRPDAPMPVYGMAEATLAVTFTRPGTPLGVHRLAEGRTVVSVGSPVAGTSVAIASDTGGCASEGTVGEVMVRSASLMDGYYRNEQASSAAIRDGWLHTGDLGFIARGSLFITGRRKEMIIKAGKNLYPQDVERIAEEIGGVRLGAVAAVARANERTGTEDLVVVVESAERDAERRAEVAKSIRGEVLAALGVKVDDVVWLPIGRMPRTTSGKIQRSACADLDGGETR